MVLLPRRTRVLLAHARPPAEPSGGAQRPYFRSSGGFAPAHALRPRDRAAEPHAGPRHLVGVQYPPQPPAGSAANGSFGAPSGPHVGFSRVGSRQHTFKCLPSRPCHGLQAPRARGRAAPTPETRHAAVHCGVGLPGVRVLCEEEQGCASSQFTGLVPGAHVPKGVFVELGVGGLDAGWTAMTTTLPES